MPPKIRLPRGFDGTTDTAEHTATGFTDHLRAAHPGALRGSLPPAHRQEVPLEITVSRGPRWGSATPSAEDGLLSYTVLVRVWLSEDYPIPGSIQPSMWYDRLQSRVEFLEDTLREMLRAFEAQIPVCPKGQTVADFTATWGPERRHELENNYVLRVETVSGRHPKGRCEYFPPNLCGPKPNFYKSQHRFELPPDQTGQSLVAALDVWFHCCRWPSPEGMMLRQEMDGWAPSLLEGVCLLADAHEHSHMQQPVCFPPPLSKHPQLLKVQAALNAAFLRVDHDCADEIRVRAGGPPEPFDKEGYTTLPLIMFPGPAAICLTDPEVTLMHSNRKRWSEEVMAPVNSAWKATSDPDCYLLDSIHPPSADKKQLLLLQRTIEFAVNEGGDVWNFVHQFLGRAICLMPILGVAPYLELYQALAHYVISYRLYTAEDMRAQSELVSPFLLGRFLILGPIQRYLGARPEAARRMLNEYSHGSLKFSTDWEFYQQLIRLWHRHLADSQAPYFPEQPSQRFPCAWQPPYFHEVPEYCGGGTVHGWPPFTMYAECKVTHPSHRDYYTAWQSAWSMGRLPDKPFDLYRCYPPRPANLTPPSEPLSSPIDHPPPFEYYVFPIYIREMGGANTTLRVNETTTVGEVWQQLESTSEGRLSARTHVLISGGRWITDESNTMNDEKMEPERQLHMAERRIYERTQRAESEEEPEEEQQEEQKAQESARPNGVHQRGDQEERSEHNTTGESPSNDAQEGAGWHTANALHLGGRHKWMAAGSGGGV